MDISLKSEDGCQKIYEVKASWEEIAPRFGEVTKTLKSQVRLPGFRPGKAPETMVRGQFRKAIREEVLEHLLEDSAKAVLEKFELKPVLEPFAADVHLDDGQPYSVDITIEVAPEVPEISASGVAIDCPKFEVTQEQVDRAIESIRQRAAVMKPVEGEALEGDFAMAVITRKGQAKGLERFLGALPKSEHPIERVLAGKKAGDEFEVTVGEEAEHVHAEGEEHVHGEQHLAPGDYVVKVSKLARREVPELGDDLAKDVGAESFGDLKAKVKLDLEARVQSEMRDIQEERLIDALAAKFPFPVPPTQVERQLRGDLEEFAENLSRQGMDVGKAGVDWTKMAEARRPMAQKKVVAYYLLDAVARQNAIEATGEEVEAYFVHQARGTGLSPDQLKAQAKKDDRLDIVRSILIHRKAADLLLSQASVTFTEGKAASQETT